MLSWLCVGVLLGLLGAKLHAVALSVGWLIALGAVVIVTYRRQNLLAIGALVLLGLALGWQRGSHAAQELTQYRQHYFQNVTAEGRVATDPTYDDKGRRDFYLDHVVLNGRKMPGEMRIRAFGSATMRRGDTIRASGSLYPGFASYQGVVPFARTEIVAKSSSPIEHLRQRFFTGVYNALPDPQASLGLGFLVGYKAQLPPDLYQQLQALALTHIIVASGYNLTILIRLSRRVLARRSKLLAFAGSVGLMLTMLSVTGLSPSMSRAGVVTFLSLATWYYGRAVHPVLLILLSAAVTAWASPVHYWHDVGWWLSFVAFSGVLLLAPLLHKRFSRRQEPSLLGQIFIETLSAELLVEPIVMIVFGQFSTLGLLANAAVAPFIPMAMLLTFVAGVFGMTAPVLAGWLALPAQLLLTYIVEIVRLLAQAPWALQKISLGPTGLAVLYAGVLAVGASWYRRLHFRFRGGQNVVE